MFLLMYMAVAFVAVQAALNKNVHDDAVRVFKKMTEPYVGGCLQETNLTQEDLEPLFHGDYIPESGVSCYLKCVYRKLEIVDSNGDPILSNLAIEEAPYLTSEIAKKCAKEASFGSTACKKSYLLANCIAKALSI